MPLREVNSQWGELLVPENEAASDADVFNSIIAQYKKRDSFYLLKVQQVIDSYAKWKRFLPSIRPYYAVKSNNHEMLLKILMSLGAGFDCASKAEVKQVLSLGANANDVLFTNTNKDQDNIPFYKEKNIKMMTFDNSFEVEKIHASYPSASLLIRIRSEATNCAVPLGKIFGVELCDTENLLIKVKNIGAKVSGVAFHVGSLCYEVEAYERAIQASKQVFDQARALGFDPYILNIGGGFHDSKDSPFERTSKVIIESINKYFPIEDKIKVIAEPGAFFSGPSMSLATRVISKREEKSVVNSLNEAKYFINDGFHGSFFDLVFWKTQISFPRVLNNSEESNKVCATIHGPTSSPSDTVMEAITLPRLDIDDWLIWDHLGSYSLVFATTFNGFPIPEVFPVINERLWKHIQQLNEENKDLASMFTETPNEYYEDKCIIS